jgi:hypothetical protein
LDDIEVDYFINYMVSVPVKSYQALGNYDYQFAHDGSAFTHNQADAEFMTADDYTQLIENPMKFMLDRRLRLFRSLQLPRAEAYEKVKEALVEFEKLDRLNKLLRQRIYEEKGIINLGGSPLLFISPLSDIFSKYRGIKDTLVDLRRRPELVRQAHQSLMNLKRMQFNRFSPSDFAAPHPCGGSAYNVECFLPLDLFDEFYLEPFIELFLPYIEAGMKVFLMGEGSTVQTLDRFRQLPKGSMVIQLAEDNPFEAYKVIGDWQTIATGISVEMLKMATKQQCVDYVKKCFETFAPGGGFIFTNNMSLLSPNDAKPENILAVYEVANELSRQH